MKGNYKEFIDFLKYIGLITQKTEEVFKKSLNVNKNKNENENENENDIYSFLSNILETYLTLLTNNETSTNDTQSFQNITKARRI